MNKQELLAAEEDTQLINSLKKIVFDAEDCPPPSYYVKNKVVNPTRLVKNQELSGSQHKVGGKKISDSEWVKAPEFVPKVNGNPPDVVPQILSQSQSSLVTFQPSLIGRQPTRGVLGPASTSSCYLNHPAAYQNLPGVLPHLRPAALMPAPLVPLAHPLHRLPPGAMAAGLRPMDRVPLIRPMVQQHPGSGRPLNPLGPAGFLSKHLQPAVIGNQLPPGYRANFTAITSGLGPPIPAIVIKKKRKKRRKNRMKSTETPENAHPEPVLPESALNSSDNKKIVLNSRRHWPFNDREEEEEEEVASSTSGSTFMATSSRRSEPDLTKIGRHQIIGNPLALMQESGADEFPTKKGDYLNSLDLIQNDMQNGHFSLTNSCPDLSEVQRDMLEDFWDFQQPENQVVYVNTRMPTLPLNDNTKQSVSGENAEVKNAAHDFEVSSPAARNALENVLQIIHVWCESIFGHVKLEWPNKALDREIIAKMQSPYKLDASYIAQDAATVSDEEPEDRIFDRLLRTSKENEKKHWYERNPARDPKSLMEEIEEKQLLFPDRVPVHFAVVHSRNGTTPSSLLLDPKSRDKRTEETVQALFPPPTPTYFEDDEVHGGMHITVNAFEDPEELILDEDDPASRNRFSRIQNSIKELGSMAYSRAVDNNNPLQPPKSKACCSMM